MLMNIILRPGGGDKSKALPRPKVDVKADGPNVIIIRMTFPDNENIQGLRAFTPTQPEEISQFSAINEILPPNTKVERISAQSQEAPVAPASTPDYYDTKDNEIEYEYYYDDEPVPREERQPQEAFFAPVTPAPTPSAPLQVSALPTRPQRPFRANIPPPQPPVLLGAHSHIPPPPSGFKRPPPPPSPPSPPAPPSPPRPPKPPTLPNIPGGAKRPRLYINSSLTSGKRNFGYNVSVDRRKDKRAQQSAFPGLPNGLPSLDKQDWRPIFNNA